MLWLPPTMLRSEFALLAGGIGSNIGDMTLNGGLAAAFDGNTNQGNTACAAITSDATNYIGKNCSATPKIISSVTVYSSNNLGYTNNGAVSATLTLYAKQSLPANSTDGISLGSTTFTNAASSTNTNTITSNDQYTAWAYFWVAILCGGAAGQTKLIAEIQFTGYGS